MSVDILHFAAATYYWLCAYYEFKYVNIPPEVDKLFELYGDKAKLSYLAAWNMVSTIWRYVDTFSNVRHKYISFYRVRPAYLS